MYARILVPLDGSPLAEGALLHARHLARAFKAPIELVCAVEREDVPEALVAELEQERLSYIQGGVAGFAGEAEPGFVVKHGHPAEVILEQADANPDTLIVMSTHGYSGLQRWFLGSVAHKIVQAATCPVFLFPPYAKSPEGGPAELRRVIVPLDGSDLAEQILPHAVAMCRILDIELILLRVYNPRFPGTTVRMHEVSEIVRDAAENYVKEKVRELRDQGLANVSYRVPRGIPAEQITDFAIETPNSLTAMCTHGRHGVGRWVLGSVTDAVIHGSEEPVLVVRALHP